MTKPNKKSQTLNSKPKTSGKIIKTKQLINTKVETRRSSRINLLKQIKFGKLSVDLQSKIGWEVLKNFKLNEQLKLRTISPAWDYNVQLVCKQVRSLVLNLPYNSNKKFTKSVVSTRIRNKFKTNIDENLRQSNKVELNIKAQKWTPSTNASLGKMFCNVDQLTIYYTMNNHNINLLCDLLQKFPKVTTFSLIILNQILKCKEHFISQLFSAINSHLASLSSLHVYFESRFTPTIDPNSLSKTLPFVQNLSLGFPIKNYPEIIVMIGKNQKSSRFPMQSLSLRSSNLKTTQIAPMFKQNPGLSRIKRLQLVDVESREVVDCLLDHFTELEYLEISLGSKLIDENDYSVEWVKTFSKMTHLTELVMNGMHPRSFHVVSPETHSAIRSITFNTDNTNDNFYDSIFYDWVSVNEELINTLSIQQLTDQMIKKFVSCFAQQYPNLKSFIIIFGENWDVHSRMELEQIILTHYGHLKFGIAKIKS